MQEITEDIVLSHTPSGKCDATPVPGIHLPRLHHSGNPFLHQLLSQQLHSHMFLGK